MPVNVSQTTSGQEFIDGKSRCEAHPGIVRGRSSTEAGQISMASSKGKPTLQSIAKHLDTSVCTVSRVLSGKGPQYRIAVATQKRVLDYVKKINYRPNIAAQGLRLNSMRDVGLILPDFSNPFFTQIAKCVSTEARKRNYSVQVSETGDTTDAEIEAVSQMLHRRVEGLIIWPVGIESNHIRELADSAQPAVLVDRCFPELAIPQVAVDNIAAAETATLHLLDFGHREIACLQGLAHTTTNEDRLKGYRRALAIRGIANDDSLVVGDGFTQSSGYRAVRQLLTSRPSVSAILSLSNQITLGALRALAEHGMGVPNDVSLVSFDEIDGVEFFATPLTVVAQPLAEIGLRAAELLFEGIDGVTSRSPRIQLLTANLIRRNSVKQFSQETRS